MPRWWKTVRSGLGRAWSALTGRGNRSPARNVTDLARYRRRRQAGGGASPEVPAGRPGAGNRCSRCRQMAGRLTFYVDEAGKPVGFCKACEPHAKRRDLLPL